MAARDAKDDGGTRINWRIDHHAGAGEVARVAARELADGLAAMLDAPVATRSATGVGECELRLSPAVSQPAPVSAHPKPVTGGDGYALVRDADGLRLAAGSERALLHGAADLLERLGARYPLGARARMPRLDPARVGAIEPFEVAPAFSRRALVSDLMTWHYDFPDRLEVHLAHDREFIAWMGRRGLNAFSYIRHAHDTRLMIDELVAPLRERGIDAEYGGHVLQILLRRDSFNAHPEYFPQGRDGARMPRGNLCASSAAALATVRDGALDYVDRYPENRLLHIWGADVRGGAWCSCERCADFAPQLQYMKTVNAIAEALAQRPDAPPVAYLAYHDTIDPDARLAPLSNVWFEWAPRERCYSHAIDDPGCEINPRYFASLKRYLDLFEGRGHVFEYYADAILFGGLGFATPAIIASDMRAYHALGIRSVSALTFGAFSALAYPVNLEAFARATRHLDFDPTLSLADTAAARHPSCPDEMAGAYRAIEQASRLTLDYADVMRPAMTAERAVRKRRELSQAAERFRTAIEAADFVIGKLREASLTRAERGLWRCSAQTLEGLAEYLGAIGTEGAARRESGEAALVKIDEAAKEMREIAIAAKGTWGEYDFERFHALWLEGLRRALYPSSSAAKESP